jgi:chromatin segregation and condensation protein Rec8/ScpA/Scc1 (kleisin family)
VTVAVLAGAVLLIAYLDWQHRLERKELAKMLAEFAVAAERERQTLIDKIRHPQLISAPEVKPPDPAQIEEMRRKRAEFQRVGTVNGPPGPPDDKGA